MKSEKIIKVDVDSWSNCLKVTCGDTSREFKKPHWPTVGFIVGFACWLKDNEWAVEEAFRDCDEKNVAYVMLNYVTEALENKSTGLCECCMTHEVELADGLVAESNNVYLRLLDSLNVHHETERDVWADLVREELKLTIV